MKEFENRLHMEERLDPLDSQLFELGLPQNQENRQAVSLMSHAAQFPDGYADILQSLHDPENLLSAMKQHGIEKIVHAEGPTVWDHVKLVITQINQMTDIDDATRADLRLLALYHDLGKVEVSRSRENQELTQKRLAKHELHQAMIGHEKASQDAIQAGLEANGITGSKLQLFVKVIQAHMYTYLMDEKANIKKVMNVIDNLGMDVMEKKEAAGLLALLLQADGLSTVHICLSDGQLDYRKNEEKVKFDPDFIWNRYEEGITQNTNIEKKQSLKEKQKAFEAEIFSEGGIASYLQSRGLETGPSFGLAVKHIKSIINQHQEKTAQEIRRIIDQLDIDFG